MKRKKISKAEWSRVQSMTKGKMLLKMENSMDVVKHYGIPLMFNQYGDGNTPASPEKMSETMSTISNTNANAFLSKYFVKKNISVVVLCPKENYESGLKSVLKQYVDNI